MTIRIVRNFIMGGTTALWVLICWAFWQHLVEIAADSPEIYARGAGFQFLNFLIQYLWFFVLLLAVTLVVEWLVFHFVARFRICDQRQAG